MPSFGEAFAQATQGSFSTVANAYQTQQIMQLEQQKQNLQGYQQFYNMLQTMDPATLKAMKPTIMKNFFGVDPGDKDVGAFFDQAINGNTQIGTAVRNAFSSLQSNDPNNPVMKMMMNMPVQNFAQMARDPSKMVSFLSGINSIALQTQGIKTMQGIVNNLPGGNGTGQPPQPSQPQPTQSVQAVPQPTSQPSGQTPSAPGQVPSSAAVTPTPIPAAQPSTPAAPAPQSSTTSQSAPQAVQMPPALANEIATKRKLSLILSQYPNSQGFAKQLQDQADKQETNFIAQQSATGTLERGAAAISQANTAKGTLDLKTKEGTYGNITPVEQNASGFMPGAVVQKSGTNSYKVVQDDPDKQLYTQEQQRIFNDQQTSQKALQSVNSTISLLSNTKLKTTAGPFANTRLSLSRLAAALGHPELSTNLLGHAPSTEAEQAAIAQATTLISSQLRKNFGAGSAQLENIEENLPDILETRDGQLAISKLVKAGLQREDMAGDILRQHIKQFGHPWTRETNGKLDPNGQNGFDKVNAFMRSSEGIPQDVIDQLNVHTEGVIAPPPGQRNPQVVPPANAASGFKFLGAVQ